MAEEEREKLEEISISFKRRYDSLTDEEVAEDQAWGEFAETQFPDDQLDGFGSSAAL